MSVIKISFYVFTWEKCFFFESASSVHDEHDVDANGDQQNNHQQALEHLGEPSPAPQRPRNHDLGAVETLFGPSCALSVHTPPAQQHLQWLAIIYATRYHN
jgi:hypothetical protein